MWFVFALLGAVGKSYSSYFRKKIAKNVSGSMYIWTGFTLILLILGPFMLFRISEVSDALTQFPIIILGAALSYMIATQLNLEALKREDLSYIAPLGAFVPIFTLCIAFLFLDENPPKLGFVGVMVVVIGAYIISIKPERINWYDPLKRLFNSAGAQLSIGVALCYAVNTVLLKALTNNGYDAFIVLYATTLAGWLLMLYVPVLRLGELKKITNSDKAAVLGGGLSAFAGNFFHILAVSLTFTSYAASVRRLDAVISVLIGWHHLKEKDIRIKLIGSIIMTVGVVMMTLS